MTAFLVKISKYFFKPSQKIEPTFPESPIQVYLMNRTPEIDLILWEILMTGLYIVPRSTQHLPKRYLKTNPTKKEQIL